MPAPFLSIIIPAHNEEQRLPPTLQKIAGFAGGLPYPIEVVVVENGSIDRTADVARSFQSQMPYLRVLEEKQAGKGLAVRKGMLAARGDYRFICDADLSMPIEEISGFIPPLLADLDVAIASREAPGAVRINEPPFRHLTGRVFNTVVRMIALPGLQDTQCGFKCFRAAVAEDVFRRQTLNGWAFDVEVLFIARRSGYRVVEIPIHWYFDCNSQVRVFKDTWRMLRELILIREMPPAACMTAKFDLSLLPPTPDLRYESALWGQGFKRLGGIDEAGRGAWAGPVAAAVLVLPDRPDLETVLAGVRDSNQMTPAQRNWWTGKIKEVALAWGVGLAACTEIDSLGILAATRLAAQRALSALPFIPDHLFIDFITLPGVPISQTCLVKGDARVLSIAGASVLAKTARDADMELLDKVYPGYGFARHKGYGTAAHLAALQSLGPIPAHRFSFAPVKAVQARLK